MANNGPSLPLPRGTFTDARPHPSRGGNPYSDDFRNDVITRYLLDISIDTNALNALRAVRAYPSIQTCMRFINKYHQVGHVQPKRATGNREAQREIRGQALVHLAMFRVAHPERTIDHVRAFLYTMKPTVLPYSPSQVVRAEQLLDLRRKASSTTCERAFLPISLHKRSRFWNQPYPFGATNVRTRDMIDMDQAGFKIEATNRKFGKVVSWERCYIEGQYLRDEKLNCMMAVSADDVYDMEWHDLWPQTEGGTTIYKVYTFFEQITD